MNSDMSKAIETVLDRTLEVYELKRDPEETQKRYKRKEAIIKWTLNELEQGPIEGGTVMDIIDDGWMFGDSSYWIAIRDAIKIRDPVCRICGKRPTQEVHHIHPRFLGGKHHPRNLIGLCYACHDEVHRQITSGIEDVLKGSLSIEIPTLPVKLEKWRE